MLHGHGDDWYRYKEEVRYNFSSNVWHEGTAGSLLEVVRESSTGIGKYPSPNAEELAALAASHHGLTTGHCLFTNGATEAFYLIAQLFSKRTATIFAPTFAEYEDACRLFGLEISFQKRSAVNTTRLHSALAFICNPNNPDSITNSPEEIEALLKAYPETIFVLDEAYIDFAANASSSLPLLHQYQNLLIVKSLTKLFAIPGLRLGYVLAHPLLIQKLQAGKMPWSVNSMAIAAGKTIFPNYETLKPDIRKGIANCRDLQDQISQIPGFKVVPSATTYFLVKLEKGTAAGLKDYLMQQHQLLVRDATNFRGLEGEHIRLATQSEKGNSLLLKALKDWSA